MRPLSLGSLPLLTLSFSPLVPVLWLAAAVVTLLAVLACLSRGPVAIVRAIALALILVALANPALVHAKREPMTSIVMVVLDRSASNQLGDRAAMTERVRAELQRCFSHLPDVEARFIEAGTTMARISSRPSQRRWPRPRRSAWLPSSWLRMAWSTTLPPGPRSLAANRVAPSPVSGTPT
jgi:hypothetical protein